MVNNENKKSNFFWHYMSGKFKDTEFEACNSRYDHEGFESKELENEVLDF